jgi:hypothetical protein
VVAMEDQGSWEANCAQKAEFIKVLRRKWRGLPVVWVDADALAGSAPQVFTEQNGADFAADTHDGEVLTETLYFAPNRKATNLLNRWIKEQEAAPGEKTQRTLARALDGWRGKWAELPPEVSTVPAEVPSTVELSAEALIEAKPTVICFYTETTSYQREAEEMRATVEPHGFPVVLRGVKDLGSWQANTYRKAAFLESMLRELDKPVIWMDADSRVRQYPWFLDEWAESGSDFTVCWIDWSRFRGIRRTDRELDSAVMGLKPTKAVFQLLSRWQTLNRQVMHTGVFEQKNLQQILDSGRHGLTITELPMSHCQIFDTMSELGEPVIEQMQASRRLKNERAAV